MRPMFILLLTTLALTTTKAAAAETELHASPEYLYGSYCNAAAADGIWGFYFGPMDQSVYCNQVQRGIDYYSSGPIIGWRSGYYRRQGYNRAVAECDWFRRDVSGYGEVPLQRVYELALNANAQRCFFYVY